MQNRNNKKRQEKRAEKRLEKQKIQLEVTDKKKELEKKEEKIVESQENVVVKQETPEETKGQEQEQACCQSCQNCEEAVEEPKEEKEAACCCQEEPKEKEKCKAPEVKTAEVKAKDNSSYGEFFIGLTIGAVLLALGALIVFLFQVDYMRGLEKKVNELQNSSAKSEIKTDLKTIQDKMFSLEKKTSSVDSSARFQEMENKIVVLQKQIEGNKEDAKKFATLETLNTKVEQVEKTMAAQKQDFDHFKTLQDMSYQEIQKKMESFKQDSSLENTTKALGENLEKAQTNFQEKTNEIQKQLDALKQNDLSKVLEMKLEFLQTTLQTLQQQNNEHLEGFKKIKESVEALSSQVEKLSTPSSEPK